MSNPPESVDDVVALFDAYARERYDEEVSQLDHALQTAALARLEGASDALVVAALLHDVGHLLWLQDHHDAEESVADESAADRHHEATGARWLARLYGPEVTGPIALHVAAKRFVCAVEPDYHASLSAGSRASLVAQGGPMDAGEVERFGANPAHQDAVRLRRWDDSGKQTDGVDVAPFDAYRPLLEDLARNDRP